MTIAKLYTLAITADINDNIFGDERIEYRNTKGETIIDISDNDNGTF